MNDPLDHYLRWRAADESGRDEDADRECRNLFQAAAVEPPVSPAFTARTMAAVAAASDRDARRARHTRRAAISAAAIGGTTAAYFGTGWLVGLLSTVLIGLLNLLIGGVVRAVTALQTGADVWAVLASMGRAAAAFAADPKVTVAIIALHAVAITALVALQRFFGSDGGSFE
ncbi:MAG: hypothetical protein ABI818_05590 [Acidobacteriota bacterium]